MFLLDTHVHVFHQDFIVLIHDNETLLSFVLHFDLYCIVVLRQFFPIYVVTSTEIKQKVWDKDKPRFKR